LPALSANVAACPHRRNPLAHSHDFPNGVFPSVMLSASAGATQSDAALCGFAQLCIVAIPYIDG
jgi:hypothetical protein